MNETRSKRPPARDWTAEVASYLLQRRLALLPALTVLLTLPSCSAADTADEGRDTNAAAPSMMEVLVPPDSPDMPERGFFMGVLAVPPEGQTFEECYRRVSRYADFVPVWGRPSPFFEMGAELSGNWGQTFVEEYTHGNDLFPLVHLSFIGADMTLVTPPGIEQPSLTNPQWRDAYKQAALEAVRASRPLYLSLGNEVNRWYEAYGTGAAAPNGFQHYVSLYKETYDAVKELSPQTRVFCTFAREMVSGNREADMDVLRMFDPDKLDILMLTTYPHAVRGINRPSDVPPDYYSRLTAYMPTAPMGFSEAAWPSVDAFGGEQGQAEFLTDMCSRLTRDAGVDLALLTWSWLTDLGEGDHSGLLTRDGNAKAAWGVWQGIFDSGR